MAQLSPVLKPATPWSRRAARASTSTTREKAWPGSQGGTYGANAVACAAAIATLDVIREEELVENAAVRGRQLKDALRAVADRFKQITDVRGLGLMIGNEFRDADGKPSGALAAAAQHEAAAPVLLLLTCGAWSQVVRFIPALVVGEQDAEEAAQIWSDAVGAVLSPDDDSGASPSWEAPLVPVRVRP